MGIIGTLYAQPYEERVGAMKVGQLAYLKADCLIITRKIVFVDLLSPIVLEKHYYDDVNDEYVSIRRIGPGNTEDDFEIDTTILDLHAYTVEDTRVFINGMKRMDTFILFRNFDLEVCYSTNKHAVEEMEEETYDSLVEKLAEAEQEERYEEAAQLRQRIESLNEKK